MVHIRKFGIGCWIPWTWYHCLTNLEEKYWNIIFSSFSVLKPDACDPSPCGPGTMCMSDMGNPICRCLAGLIPKPDAITGCGPEGKVWQYGLRGFPVWGLKNWVDFLPKSRQNQKKFWFDLIIELTKIGPTLQNKFFHKRLI